MEPEEDLIRRAQAGAADSFRELVRLHQAQVHAFLGRYIARLDAVEDLAQETFLKAYRNLQAYRGESSFRVWLLGIAKNEALMHLRGERARRAREASSYEATLTAWMADRLEPAGVEDEDRRLLALEACVRGLAPESAGIVEGFYFRGHSVAEIARTSGKREGAVKMALLRIRQALRECVELKVAPRRLPS